MEVTRVSVDQLIDVSDHRVVKDAAVPKVGEVGHILSAIKLGRVDLADLVFFEGLHLTIDQDRDFAARLVSGETLQVASRLETGHPDGLLRVVWLSFVGLLDVVRDRQPGRGVWLWPVELVLVTRHAGSQRLILITVQSLHFIPA